MIVGLRLRMDDDGKIHAGCLHDFQQMLRCGSDIRPIWCPRMIRKPRVVLAGEAVQMCVDDRGAFFIRVKSRGQRGAGGCAQRRL